MTIVEPRTRALPLFAAADYGVRVAHVASNYLPYVGEPVTFYTRVEILDAVPGFSLRIELPPELTPSDTRASANHGHEVADVLAVRHGHYVSWKVERKLQPGEWFEYAVETHAAHVADDVAVTSEALVVAEPAAAERVTATAALQLAISTRARYLKYLPMLYEEDDLMSRFLMLFESFWKPIENQIEQIHEYFDPKMTTPTLLPFLASWVDLDLDDRWPEDRQRKLLLAAAQLHRRRGTRQGLREILEIYTGGEVFITEHTAKNFRLGADAHLGRGIALGRGNRPHTFTVNLRVPALEAADGADGEQRERDRRLAITDLVEANKPAHATYTLHIEII